MAMKSSDFFRLEKLVRSRAGYSYVDVYEFHRVVNGNCYIARTEEHIGSSDGYHHPHRPCTPETGNAEYKRLKAKGYVFAGKWEMDIFGYKTRKEELA